MNNRFLNIVYSLANCLVLFFSFSTVVAQSAQLWTPLQVNVVLKPESLDLLLNQAPWTNNIHLAKTFSNIGVKGIKKRFPAANIDFDRKSMMHKMNENYSLLNKDTNHTIDNINLTHVYQISLDGRVSEEIARDRLIASKAFKWVELEPIDFTFSPQEFMPNDSLINVFDLWWINKLEMPKAWNITTGDTQIVTAIIDSGTDYMHHDLRENLAYNYNEPIDGQDNDNDGYADNFQGWDFVGPNIPPNAQPDNDPRNPRNPHGTQMAGLAAATTNNRIGIPSPGFQCRYVPLKVSAEEQPGNLIAAYDAIIYAANKGYAVINCSFGSTIYSPIRQAVIDYAINRNCLILAAAGNTGTDTIFYPASYAGVFSVASTEMDDTKSPLSSYNYSVDFCAPGAGIVSTNLNQDYWYDRNGYTSVSCAIASGAAALVRSYYPNYTGQQVGELLRVTADPVVTSTSSTNDKLGKGRINVYRALTTSTPSVRVVDHKHSTNASQDTLRLQLRIANYLASCQNLRIRVQTENSFLQPITNETTVNQINTLETIEIGFPFSFKIAANAPNDLALAFRIEFQAANYSDWQVISISIKPTFVNLNVNQIGTSVTSIGGFGYANPLQNTKGLGFQFLNSRSWLFEGGFLVGNSIAQVSDNIRSAQIGNPPENDFRVVQPMTLVESGPNFVAYRGVFEDWKANKIGLLIDYQAKGYTDSIRANVVELQYSIKNNSSQPIENLIASLFADWDLDEPNQCQAQFDTVRQMILIYYNNRYIGVKIHNENQARGSIVDIINGMDVSTIGKFQQMRNILSHGSIVGPSDLAHFLGTSPFRLNPQEEKRVKFSLIAGNNLEKVQRSADALQELDCQGLNFLLAGQTTRCSVNQPIAIQFVMDGGTPPYRFFKDNQPLDTLAWKNTALGTQVIEVLDDNGCRAEASINIPLIQPLRIHSIFTSKNTCDSCQTGFVVIHAKGGIAPYIYSINGQSKMTERFGGLTKGTYQLMINDSQGCSLEQTVSVD